MYGLVTFVSFCVAAVVTLVKVVDYYLYYEGANFPQDIVALKESIRHARNNGTEMAGSFYFSKNEWLARMSSELDSAAKHCIDKTYCSWERSLVARYERELENLALQRMFLYNNWAPLFLSFPLFITIDMALGGFGFVLPFFWAAGLSLFWSCFSGKYRSYMLKKGCGPEE